MKKKVFIILVIGIMLLNIQSSFAHLYAQRNIISWGESIGWSIDEQNHTNSRTLYYKFSNSDAYLNDTYKNIVRSGARAWISYGTISESSSAIGTIHTYSDSTGPYVALFYDITSDSSGHLTSSKIKMNRCKNVTGITMAHEFGHVYGMNDLQDPSNNDKLLYYSEARTVSSPVTCDGRGFNVITGIHYNHSWVYTPVHGTTLYKKSCTVCCGFTYVQN